MNAMGLQAFDQVKQQTQVSTDPKWNDYVRCVALPITKAAESQTDIKNWDIVVFNDDKIVNAFALPGGKIGVYTGILKVAKTDAQLATVLAHETGHVIAKHGAERASQGLVEQVGIVGAQVGGATPVEMAALGLGANVGIVLPFSRTQESEADLIGLDLMARAGFDPRQSIELWHNMTAAAGSGPPQWLSDHPANQNRIDALQAHLPDAISKYDQAKAAGLAPHCVAPQK